MMMALVVWLYVVGAVIAARGLWWGRYAYGQRLTRRDWFNVATWPAMPFAVVVELCILWVRR